MMNLNELEIAVLEMMLVGDHPLLNEMRRQLAVCHVGGRDYTGHGFFTSLQVDTNTVTFPQLRRLVLGDIMVDAEGLEDSGGFALFIKDGLISTLEGFSFADIWPDQITTFRLWYFWSNTQNYNNGERNWQALYDELDQTLKSIQD